MKKITTLSLVIFSLILASLAIAAEVNLTTPSKTTTVTISSTPVFTRSLTVGSYGQDVMALKKILGLELSATLDTSPSFTANTAIFVKKLQEKYAIEILIPNGLSAGTGAVGQSTITKLNILASKYYVKLSDFTLPVVSTIKNVFLVNLQLGSVSDDVVLLKTILNSDASTALSPKNSTNIYDAATVIAVNKFQMKYASEILAPSGLTSGTGTVGPATRKKLNSMINNLVTPTQIAASTSTKSSTVQQYNYNYDTSNSITPYTNPVTTYYSTATNLPYGTPMATWCNVGFTNMLGRYADGNGSSYTQTVPGQENNSICANNSAKKIIDVTLSGLTTGMMIDPLNDHIIHVYTPPLKTYKNVGRSFISKTDLIQQLESTFQISHDAYELQSAATYNNTRTPVISFKGKSVSPVASQDFSKPVSFPVIITAIDNSTSTYTIKTEPIVCPNYYADIPFVGKITNASKDWVGIMGIDGAPTGFLTAKAAVLVNIQAEDNSSSLSNLVYNSCNIPIPEIPTAFVYFGENQNSCPVNILSVNTNLKFDNCDKKKETEMNLGDLPPVGAWIKGTLYFEPKVYINTCARFLAGICDGGKYNLLNKSAGYEIKNQVDRPLW